jgi:serine/threonine protein kinase
MGELERSSQTGNWTDRFEVRHKIAAGSYGVVYLAHDRQRGLEVALKVLRDATTGVELYRF